MSTTSQQILFLDPAVGDTASFLSQVDPSIEVVLLSADRGGLEQIAEALAGRTGVDAVHIVSHGGAGYLQLGNGTLDQSGLGLQADALATIGSALSESADLLLYGCEVAAGDAGAAFISALADATGADVAASVDVTGAAWLGGDWELEASTGAIETTPVAAEQLDAVLASGILRNAYVRFGYSDDGTLGVGANAKPGIQYDPNGTRNFLDTADSLTPGSPFEGFTVKVGSTSYTENNASNGGAANQGTYILSTDLTTSGSDTWGSVTFRTERGGLRIDQTYTLASVDAKVISMTVRMENISGSAVSNVSYARFTDPDVDSNGLAGSTSRTNNVRGATGIAASDIVLATGPVSGRVIGLYSDSSFSHNTSVDNGWSSDPSQYLSGAMDGNGDYTIGIGFNLGNFAAGESKTFSFAYVFAASAAALAESVAEVPRSNAAPTLSSFAAPVDTVAEDTQIEITYAELAAQGNEADDGSVAAFVVKSITSGTLRIGSSAGTATAWTPGSNDAVPSDGSLKLYWTPAADANGTLNAFTVVARDDEGAVSTSNVQVQVSVSAVNDAPTMSANVSLRAIDEDASVNNGSTIATLAGGVFADPDAGQTLGGLIVTGNDADPSTEGQWEYTTDGGSHWFAVGSVSDSAGLALSAATQLRFVPVANYNGTPGGLTVHDTDSAYAGGYTAGATTVTFDTTTDSTTAGVSDGSRSVSVTVNAVNDAPAFTSPPVLIEMEETDAPDNAGTLVLDVGSSLSGTVTASDEEGDAVSFSIRGGQTVVDESVFQGTYGELRLNTSTGAWTYTANRFDAIDILEAGEVALDVFSLKVADAGGASSTQTLTVNITGADDVPLLASSLTDATVYGNAWTYQIPVEHFTNAEGKALTYTVELVDGSGDPVGDGSLPAGLTFDGATRTFTGASPLPHTGQSYHLKVTADDGTVPVDDVFMLTVSNHVPVSSDDSGTVVEDVARILTVADFGNYSDADADALAAVQITVLPGAGTLEHDSGSGWVAVSADDEITVADIAGGQLRFVPTAGVDSGYAALQFKVSDGIGWSASSYTLTLNFAAVNDAPAVGTPLADQSVAQDAALSFDASTAFADVDGPSLRFGATLASGEPLPSWLSIDPVTGVLSGTPAAGDVGALNVTVTAWDGGAVGSGLSASDTFTLTVTDVDDAPVTPDVIGTVTATEDVPFAFKVPGLPLVDADGTTITYTIEGPSHTALPGWLSYDPATGVLSGTPANGDVGSVALRVYASDGTTEVGRTFTLDVVNTNDRPTGTLDLTSSDGALTDLQAGDTLTATPNALADVDGGVGALTYQWYANGVAIGGANASSYTLTASEVGKSISATVSYTDGRGTLETVVSNATLTVNDGSNANPTFNSGPVLVYADSTPIDANIKVGDTIQAGANSVDEGGVAADPATFVYTWLADGVAIPGATGGSFTLTPDQAGKQISFLWSYVDGNGNTETIPFPQTPRVQSLPSSTDDSVTIDEDSAYALTLADFGSYSNADGDPLAVVKITSLPGAGTLTLDGAAVTANQVITAADIGAGKLVFTPAANAAGSNYAGIGFQVGDAWQVGSGYNYSSSYTLTVNVTPVDDVPLVSAQLDQTVTEGDAFSMGTASAFSDPDGTTLKYSATLSDGSPLPAWLSFDADSGVLSGTPANGDVGVVQVTVTAWDGGTPGTGQSASDTFAITVLNANNAPTVDQGIADQSVAQGSAFSLAVPGDAFADLDAGTTLSYTATLSNGDPLPAWLGFSDGVFSGTPANGDVGTVSVKVTASDGSLTVDDTFDLVVTNVNDAPVASPLADQTLAQLQAGIALGSVFSDIDVGDTLTLATPTLADGSALPGWLHWDPVTRTLEPAAADAVPGGLAYVDIVVSAEDAGGLSAETSFRINLTDAGLPTDTVVGALLANTAGTVSVTGTPTQGETLTAQAPTDVDGASGSVTYQWQVSRDGGSSWQDIGGARGQATALTLAQTEAGQQVRVQAFYSDDGGIAEAPVSSAVTVADLPEAGSVSVSGSLVPGQALTAVIVDADGLAGAAPTYQWQVSANGSSGWTNISGATSANYTLTNADGGQHFRVLTSYTDDMGNVETNVTSSSRGPVQLGAVAPVASNDAASVTEASGAANAIAGTSPATGNLLGNDSDSNVGDTLTVTGLRSGSTEGFGEDAVDDGTTFTVTGDHGTLVVNKTTGAYTYTLNEDSDAVQALAVGDSLTDRFNYSVSDDTDLSDTAVLTITIDGANDQPTLSGAAASATVAEDTATALPLDLLSFVEPDSAAFELRLTVDSGTLRGTSSDPSVTVTGSDTGVLTISAGSPLALSGWLYDNEVYFVTDPDDNGAVATLGYALNDGSGFVTSGLTTPITASATNDSPIVDAGGAATDGNDSTATFRPRGDAVAVAPDLTLSDIDSATLNSATVTLTAGALDNQFGTLYETLGLSAAGQTLADDAGLTLSSTPSASGAVLTLTGSATVAEYQAVLREVQYLNSNPNAFAGDRTVTLSVTDDADAASNAASFETAAANTDIAVGQRIFIDGVDSGFTVATVLDDQHFVASGDLADLADGATLSFRDGTGEVTTATASGPLVATTTVNVPWTPVIDMNGSADDRDRTIGYTEGQGAVAIATADASITDQGGLIRSLTVTLTNPQDNGGATVHETLSVPNATINGWLLGRGITASGNGTGTDGLTGATTIVYTASGAGSDATNFQVALRGTTYSNTSQNPDTTQREVTVSSVDVDGNTGVAATTFINPVAVNDAPAGVDSTVTATEDTTYTFGASDFGFSDPTDGADGAADALASVIISSLPAGGTLQLDGVDVSVGDEVSLADITAGLLTYAPDADASGPAAASFGFQVRDNGGTANGGVDLDATPATLTIDITPVNDAPLLSGEPIHAGAIDEDVALTSNTGVTVATLIADGSFSDVDLSPASSAPEAIGVTAVDNSHGQWQYKIGSGFWTAFNFSGANAATALLLDPTDSVRFVPSANWNGEVTDGLSFKAWDQTEGAAGDYLPLAGEVGDTGALSVDGNTLSLTVTSVNDRPFISGRETASVNEDGSISLSGFTLGDADVDRSSSEGANELTVRITLPSASVGSLSLGQTSGITFADGSDGTELVFSGSANDLQAAVNSLVFTPTAEFSGDVPIDLAISDDAGDTWQPYTTSVTGKFYYDFNGHYYEFVPYVAGDDRSWATAETLAAGRTLYGMQGYLATVTSAEENAFIAPKLGGSGWIGASDTASEGVWTWVTGPEAGQQFWQDETRELGVTETFQGYTVNGMYANWSSNEPNNYSGSEDYAHFFSNGLWNDYPATSPSIQGYVVEYGGMPGDAPTVEAAQLTVTVAARNDAPVATPVAPDMTTIGENDTANTGNLVSELVNGEGQTGIVDVDTGAPNEYTGQGIAVHGLSLSGPGTGSWQYTLDGGTTWLNVADLADDIGEAHALLLESSDSLRFVPDAENAVTGTVSYYLWDGASGVAGDQVDVSEANRGGTTAFSLLGDVATLVVTPVNDAPTVDLNGAAAGIDSSIVFSPRGGAVALFDADDLIVADVDDGEVLTRAELVIDEDAALDNSFGTTYETLATTLDGGVYEGSLGDISISGNGTVGSPLVLLGDGTAADYQAALLTLVYNNTNPNAYAGVRPVSVTVYDAATTTEGSGSTASAVATLDVEVNWGAVADLSGETVDGRDHVVSYTENAAGVAVVAADASLTDQDGNIASVTVTLTNPLDGAAEALFIDAGQVAGFAAIGITVTGNNSHAITLSGDEDGTYYQLALRAIQYRNTLDSLDTTARVVSVESVDIDGNVGVPAITTINPVAVDDAPTGSVSMANDTDGTRGTAAARQGDVLSVSNTLADADGMTTSTVVYQWLRDGVAIDGATGDSYTLTQDDVGAAISVRASYTDDDGFDAEVLSAATSAIVNVNDAPAVAAALNAEADEGDAALTLDLLDGATDVDGDSLSLDDINFTVTYTVDGVATGNAGLDLPAGVTRTGATLGVDPTDAAFDSLAEGDTLVIVASYTISDGNGGTVAQTQTVTITGTNDAPVASVVVDAAVEDGTTLAGSVASTDVDSGATASYALDAAVAGLTMGTDGSYSFDPSDAAYQHLAEGETLDVVASYTVTDDQDATDSATLTITVTGTNDTPVAAVAVDTATEDGALVTGNVSSTDADVLGRTASYALDAAVAGLTMGTDGSYSFDPSNAAYQYLAEGETLDVVASYTVTDDQGATDSATLTITVTGTNDTPVAVADAGTAREKSGLVNAVAGFDATGNALGNDTDVDATDTRTVVEVQALTGAGSATVVPASGSSASGYVEVAGEYGVLRLGADGSYRYLVNEEDPVVQALRTSSDTVEDVFAYTLTDASGASATSELTVTVEGANDAPTLVRVSNLAVTELTGATPNTTAVVNVGALTTDDPDDGETFVYDIIGGAQQFYFQVGTVDGEPMLQLRQGVPLNAEFLSEYSVVVRSTDALGLSTFETFVVQVGDVNEFGVTAPTFNVQPMVEGLDPNTVPENSALDSFIGVTATAVDADATNNTVTYTLVGNASGGAYTAGEFRIDAEDGKVYVAGPIDREVGGGSRTLFVKATSSDGSSAIRSLNLFIADENEHDVAAPLDVNAATNAVAENAPEGLNVGITANATDADATTNAVSYSLVNADGSAYTAGEFVIGSANGVVTVGGPLDREAGASRTIHVKAVSADGSTATSSFTVNLNDVNEFAPVFSSGATGAVNENAASSVVIYQAASSDADATAVLSYSLSGTDAALLDINASTGAVTLRDERGADFEAKPGYSFNVVASDGTNNTTQAVVVSVGNVLELPAESLAVTGNLWNGQTLTLDLSDVSEADRALLSFQWTADGVAIDGATDSSLTLGDAQVGKTIGLLVNGVGLAGAVSVGLPGSGLVGASDPATMTGSTDAPDGSAVVVDTTGTGGGSDSDQVGLTSGMSQDDGSTNPGGVITSTRTTETSGLPAVVDTPMGGLSFTATADDGSDDEETVSVPDTFSLYVDKDAGINGFWVVDSDTGRLINLASAEHGGQIVEVGDQLRLDIHVEDGSEFDSSVADDEVQVDGALGYVAPVLTSTEQDVPTLVFWF